VVPQLLPVPARGCDHGASSAGSRNSRRQRTVEQPVEVAHAERAENKNLRANARATERGSLLDVGARNDSRSSSLQRTRNLSGAVAVCVRLDDGNRRGRHISWLAVRVEKVDDVTEIGLKSGEVDACDRRANHEAARLSKRVNSRMKASL